MFFESVSRATVLEGVRVLHSLSTRYFPFAIMEVLRDRESAFEETVFSAIKKIFKMI